MPAARSSKKPRPGIGNVNGGKLHDYNPLRVNPNKQQFEPTEAQPIRQRARMGGDPTDDAAELTPGQMMLKKVQDANKPVGQKTDRELMESKGANDPKSEVGKERMRRLTKESQ